MTTAPARAAAKRTRRSPVRSAKYDPMAARRARAAVGVFVFILGFTIVWFVDGNWTAEHTMRTFGASYAAGWVVHLLITAVQVLPALVVPWLPSRVGRYAVLLWLVAVPAGVYNVLASALGIAPYLPGASWPVVVMHIVCTVLALVTAFLPERAIGMLFELLMRVYKG